MNEILQKKFGDVAPDLTTGSDFRKIKPKAKSVLELLTEFYADESRCSKKLTAAEAGKKAERVMESHEWPDLNAALKKQFADKAPDLTEGKDYDEVVSKSGDIGSPKTVLEILTAFYDDEKSSGFKSENPGDGRFKASRVLETYAPKELYEALKKKFKGKTPKLIDGTDYDPNGGRPADKYTKKANTATKEPKAAESKSNAALSSEQQQAQKTIDKILVEINGGDFSRSGELQKLKDTVAGKASAGTGGHSEL